ncbi:hypothetical protein AAC387_Pa07g2005 [Persea americana]
MWCSRGGATLQVEFHMSCSRGGTTVQVKLQAEIRTQVKRQAGIRWEFQLKNGEISSWNQVEISAENRWNFRLQSVENRLVLGL